jgi:hypothetical protein
MRPRLKGKKRLRLVQSPMSKVQSRRNAKAGLQHGYQSGTAEVKTGCFRTEKIFWVGQPVSNLPCENRGCMRSIFDPSTSSGQVLDLDTGLCPRGAAAVARPMAVEGVFARSEGDTTDRGRGASARAPRARR